MTTVTKLTDFEILGRAIDRAESHGYKMAPMQLDMYIQHARSAGKTTAALTWARGVIFDHMFAEAFFGTHELDDNGWPTSRITLWARQVFIKHMNELHRVDDSRYPFVDMLKTPEIDFSEDPVDPLELVQAERVRYELKKWAAMFPYETHRIEEFEATGGRPAYLYHLQQMVLAPNPFQYLNNYMENMDNDDDTGNV